MDNLTSGTQSYIFAQGAHSYLEFINSEDGKIFQQVQGDAITSALDGSNLKILDAGCGPGWLAKKLLEMGHHLDACDASPVLIDYAKKHFPEINFQIADLTKNLPYENNSFDVIVFSMAALDLSDQQTAFANLFRVLKPGGKLIATIVNPYYGFPVGVWKRGLWGFIFRKFASLKLRPYNFFAQKKDRSFAWSGGKLVSYFYTLPEQINAFLAAGFELKNLQDVSLSQDSKNYNLKYRLYRFPIYLLLKFKKPLQ